MFDEFILPDISINTASSKSFVTCLLGDDLSVVIFYLKKRIIFGVYGNKLALKAQSHRINLLRLVSPMRHRSVLNNS